MSSTCRTSGHSMRKFMKSSDRGVSSEQNTSRSSGLDLAGRSSVDHRSGRRRRMRKSNEPAELLFRNALRALVSSMQSHRCKLFTGTRQWRPLQFLVVLDELPNRTRITLDELRIAVTWRVFRASLNENSDRTALETARELAAAVRRFQRLFRASENFEKL